MSSNLISMTLVISKSDSHCAPDFVITGMITDYRQTIILASIDSLFTYDDNTQTSAEKKKPFSIIEN